MPRIYRCFWCDERIYKGDGSAVVSKFTGRAFCADEKACVARRLKQTVEEIAARKATP